MKIDPDHVHEDAETIEHIITPELEKDWKKCWNILKWIRMKKRYRIEVAKRRKDQDSKL